LSDGRFRIRWDHPGTYRLALSYFPGGAQVTEEFNVRAGTVVNVGTIRTLSPKALSVRVMGTRGNPIPEATVAVYVAMLDHLQPTRFSAPEGYRNTRYLASATTDDSGRFEQPLPATQLLYLSVSHPEYLESYKAIDPGCLAEPVVVLSGGATIRGSLKRDGTPLKERSVYIERQALSVDARLRDDPRFRHSPTDGWQMTSVYTDELGMFSLSRLAPGTYKVSYCHSESREIGPRHRVAHFETTVEKGFTVTVEHAYDVDFALPGDVTPSITVNLGGSPYPGAKAWLEPEDGGAYLIEPSLYDPDRKPPTTDERGRITLPSLPVGTYRLVVEAGDGDTLIEHRQQVTLSSANREFTVDLNPTRRQPD
jgi:hypothetical protein